MLSKYKKIADRFIVDKNYDAYYGEKLLLCNPKDLGDSWLFQMQLESYILTGDESNKLMGGMILVDKDYSFCLYVGYGGVGCFEKQLEYYRNYIKPYKLFETDVPFSEYAKWDNSDLADKFEALRLLANSTICPNIVIKLSDIALFFYEKYKDINIFMILVPYIKEGIMTFGNDKLFKDRYSIIDKIYKDFNSSLDEELKNYKFE